MNIWKAICGLFGKNNKVYRTTIDAGKAVAPIAQPIVETLLAAHGLPTSSDAALGLLTASAKTMIPLGTNAEVDALAAYVAAHIPKI